MKRKTFHEKLLHAPYFLFQERGYSLIELVVAIGVFATVVTITSGTFILSLRGQQKTVTVQNVADNTRYAMEVMAKELRMMDVDPARLAVADNNGGACSGNCRIRFYSNMPHRNPAFQLEFFLQNGQIMFDDEVGSGPGAEPLTASSVLVSGLAFDLTGAPPASQPRVTFVADVSSAGSTAVTETRMTVQTTISPRSL